MCVYMFVCVCMCVSVCVCVCVCVFVCEYTCVIYFQNDAFSHWNRLNTVIPVLFGLAVVVFLNDFSPKWIDFC